MGRARVVPPSNGQHPCVLDSLRGPGLAHYARVPASHPTPGVGSYELMNLSEHCYSYQHRFGIYERRSDLAEKAASIRMSACAGSQEGPLTAILLRSYEDFAWQDDDIINTRALLNELVLKTGGRYRLHVLVQIRSDDSIYDSAEAYQTWVNRTVPAEFRPFATLWTEAMMTASYPDVSGLHPPLFVVDDH